jgi:acyl-coenzyme A thioesterase PaaI-like protein
MGAAEHCDVAGDRDSAGSTEQWVTTDMKTAFLSSARETDIYCVARILNLGKSRYGTAESRGPGGGLLAHHVINYSRARPESCITHSQ